jgi:hypothetical protein
VDLLNKHIGMIQINKTGNAQLIHFNNSWRPLVVINASSAIRSRSICAYVKAHGFKKEKVQKMLDPGEVGYMTPLLILC